MESPLKIVLIIITAVVGLAILSFITASVVRRIYRGLIYRDLDRERKRYRERIKESLDGGTILDKIDLLRARPGSAKWNAILEILLGSMREEHFREDVSRMFRDLGYVSYFEEKLKSDNILTRAGAIDTLAKMKSQQSTDRIIAMLGSNDPELISVSLRALGKIGREEGLSAILSRLPYLVRKSLVTRKTAEAALIQFGEEGAPQMIDSCWVHDHPKVKSILLEALSRLCPVEALPLAIHSLQNVNPEVKAKALKVISAIAWNLEDFDGDILIPLITDRSWFVRLNAARALGKLRCEKAAGALGGLLTDGNWQVRNATATALTSIGEKGIEIFRAVLREEDRYAKESICEEIERTNLVTRLIQHLASDEPEDRARSREILQTMCSLNFRTQVRDYAKWGERENIQAELNKILSETGGS